MNVEALIDLSGEIFAGISNNFSLRLYNREDLEIYLNPKIGLEVKGEIGLGWNMDEDLNNIEAIRKLKLTAGLYLTGVVGADASLVNPEDFVVELELFKFRFWEKELSAIPDIEDLSSDVQKANNGSYTSAVKTEMKGEVLSKDMKVELVVVDKEGNEIATSAPINYNGGKTYEDDPDVVVPLENSFTDLQAGNDYIAYPRITAPFFRGITGDDVIDLKNESVSFSTYNSMRDVLVKIYNDCGGKDWEYQKNWCTDAPVSEWEGVIYDNESDSYHWLFLSNNALTGTLSIEGCVENIDIISLSEGLEHISIKNCPNLSFYFSLDGCSKLLSVYLDNVKFINERIYIQDNPLLEKIEIYNSDYIGKEQPMFMIDNNPSLKTLSWNGERGKFELHDPSIDNVSFTFVGDGSSFLTSDGVVIYGTSNISNMSVDGACHLTFGCSDIKIDELILTGGVMVYHNGESSSESSSLIIPYFYAESCLIHGSFIHFMNTYGIDVTVLSLHGCHFYDDELVFSSCSNLKILNLENTYSFGTVDIRNTSNLQYFNCSKSDIKKLLFDEHFNDVEAFCLNCYSLSQEFPTFFTINKRFEYDERYTYIGDGEYIDNGYGWWFPGEPDSGHHGQ